ncbi:hypothetical protein BKA01_000994 [Pseudonocardia eucalypti]|nr:hypothetical protein [Pseudonocardia eucalypti]
MKLSTVLAATLTAMALGLAEAQAASAGMISNIDVRIQATAHGVDTASVGSNGSRSTETAEPTPTAAPPPVKLTAKPTAPPTRPKPIGPPSLTAGKVPSSPSQTASAPLSGTVGPTPSPPSVPPMSASLAPQAPDQVKAAEVCGGDSCSPIPPGNDGLPAKCVWIGAGTAYATIGDVPPPRPDYVCYQSSDKVPAYSDFRRCPADLSAVQCGSSGWSPRTYFCPPDCLQPAPGLGTPVTSSPSPLPGPSPNLPPGTGSVPQQPVLPPSIVGPVQPVKCTLPPQLQFMCVRPSPPSKPSPPLPPDVFIGCIIGLPEVGAGPLGWITFSVGCLHGIVTK